MNCFVCEHNNWSTLYKRLDKCNTCGFVKVKDKFFNIDPKKIYKKGYYQQGEYLNYIKEKRALEKNFEDRVNNIRKYKSSGRLLEIGSAYGYFLGKAKKYYKITGIDLDRETQKKAKEVSNINIKAGDFLKQSFSKNTFDIICMFDTIEHLKNPHSYIKKVNKTLKPRGIIAIETGDIESIFSKIQRSKWRIINHQIHLSYFSKKTLTTFLERNGFNILEIKYVNFTRSLAQILYQLLDKKIHIPNFLFHINITINSFDLIFVVAQKRSS